jgi:hypothetical protein
MPTCTERRRPGADHGTSTALGEACQVAKILCEKIWPLSSSEDRLKLGGQCSPFCCDKCDVRRCEPARAGERLYI